MGKTNEHHSEIEYQGKQAKKGHSCNVTKAHANHHRGKINTDTFIEDRLKRNSSYSKRKHTLFNSAKALVKLSKARVYLRIQHKDGGVAEVYDSEKKKEKSSGLSAAGEASSESPASSALVETEDEASSGDFTEQPLSPNFSRESVSSEFSPDVSADLPVEPLSATVTVTEIETVCRGTQCGGHIIVDRCRVCGEGDLDGKDWLGCEHTPTCDYWVHIQCLGFKAIPRKCLNKIEWFCPIHNA